MIDLHTGLPTKAITGKDKVTLLDDKEWIAKLRSLLNIPSGGGTGVSSGGGSDQWEILHPNSSTQDFYFPATTPNHLIIGTSDNATGIVAGVGESVRAMFIDSTDQGISYFTNTAYGANSYVPLGGAYIAGHAGGTAASVSATTSSMALGVYSFMAHDGTQWTVNAGSFTYLAAGFYGTALTQPASQSFDFRGYLGGLGFEAFTYDMRNTDSSASIYINRLGQDVDTTIGYGSGTALTIDGGTGNITAGALSGSTANSLANIDTTQTFTNKRVTRRVATTDAPGATPTTNTDNVDIQTFTGLDTAITSMTTNLSGTPVDGDKLEIRFKDDGTARAITWGASFSNGGTVYLPTTTVTSTTLRVLLEYSTITSNTWVCIAVS